MLTFEVNNNESGITLEKYVKKVLKDYPLSLIYKIFRKRDVKVNDKREDMKTIVSSGDIVKIYVPDNVVVSIENKEIQLVPNDSIKDWIVYEDEQILILNKPVGILVQKDEPNQKALDDMVKEYLLFKGEYHLNDAFIPGPAHRIDRNTSGLVMFGKTHQSLLELSELIKEHELISKHYQTIVVGEINKDGEVNAPLYKDSITNKVRVSSDGKPSITKYHVLESNENYSLLDITLITGRTHQIRVHMSYIEHPIIGDSKYGNFEINKQLKLKHQLLHASEIHFGKLEGVLHYMSKKCIKCDPPKEFFEIKQQLFK